MAKIYRASLTHIDKSLNYSNSISADEVERRLDIVFEEGDILSEDDDDEVNELESDELREDTTNTDEALGIEKVIDLGPWIYIDNSELPTITRKYNSEGDDDWDPESLGI